MLSDAVKERPIIFSGWGVRAILAGAKTQTRQIVKHGDGERPLDYRDGMFWFADGDACALRCPYGVPGDRLWVREAWQALNGGSWDEQRPPRRDACEIRYAATDELAALSVADRGYRWRPSIHMPRWASRITLEVMEVRVQRVQEISEEDAAAEGAGQWAMETNAVLTCETMRDAFGKLWDAIHGPGAWERNDWVRVMNVRRLQVHG